MALVLILGGGLGWFTYRARVQREAVAVIQSAGGDVAFSWQRSDGALVSPPPKPPWPNDLAGAAQPVPESYTL